MRVGDNAAEPAAEQSKASTSKSAKSKGKRKHKRSAEPMPTVVQTLFDTCKEVFAGCGPGVVPSPENIARLRSLLDNMKPGDVGLSRKMPYFRNMDFRGHPPITYLHLYDCPKFSIAIFCLPPSAVIPLHNHPGMTVFSKLLFGTMHIKSYDWADPPSDGGELIKPTDFEGRNLRLAKVNTDSVFTAPCGTSILYPAAGGNMHCFTAKTPCAVLDVLGPPYNDSEKRHCTYYNAFPIPRNSVSAEGEAYAWLEDRGKKPDELLVLGAEYRGPKIVPR